jgi:integrase
MSKPKRRAGSVNYYAQRAVPKDLVQALGKYPLWKSLGTSNLEEAKPLERDQQDAWDALFAVERAKLKAASEPAAQPRAGSRLSPQERAERERAQFEWERENEAYWAENDPYPDYDDLTPEQQRIRDAVDEARERAAQEPAADKQSKATTPSPAKGTGLTALVDRWAQAQKNQKTIDRMRKVVEWFEDDMGRIPVEELTPDDVLNWTEKLSKRVTPANARTKLANFNTLLRYAWMKARLIPSNPASGVSIDAKKDPEDDVQPFDLPALRAIFGSPIYTQDERPEAGAGEAAYWLPLLALYTGARLNELGQLRPTDILTVPYVDKADVEQEAWCIRIVADKADGLKLKNGWSARRLPVHPELVRLGFLRYVDAARAAGQARIFSDLRPDKYGHITGNWSKWFGRYLRGTIKVTDERMRFHSFRHAFKDYAREAEIAEDVNDAITGHKGQAVARRYGSSLNYPLRPMVTAMTAYRVTGFSPPAPPPQFRAPEALEAAE